MAKRKSAAAAAGRGRGGAGRVAAGLGARDRDGHGPRGRAFPDLTAFDAYVEGLKIAAAPDAQRDVATWN